MAGLEETGSQDIVTASLQPGTGVIAQITAAVGYLSLTLADTTGQLWQIAINDAGQFTGVAVAGGSAQTVFVNDSSVSTTYQLGITLDSNFNPQIQAVGVTYNPNSPTSVKMITASGLQSALTIVNGQLNSANPVSVNVPVSFSTPIAVTVTGSIASTTTDLGSDRTVRSVLEDISAGIRELTDFMYTLRDQFQYVQTPVSGTVQVGNFPASVTSVTVANLPSTQQISIADGMQDRVIRNLLEEMLVAIQEQTRVMMPLAPTGNLTISEGIN